MGANNILHLVESHARELLGLAAIQFQTLLPVALVDGASQEFASEFAKDRVRIHLEFVTALFELPTQQENMRVESIIAPIPNVAAHSIDC